MRMRLPYGLTLLLLVQMDRSSETSLRSGRNLARTWSGPSRRACHSYLIPFYYIWCMRHSLVNEALVSSSLSSSFFYTWVSGSGSSMFKGKHVYVFLYSFPSRIIQSHSPAGKDDNCCMQLSDIVFSHLAYCCMVLLLVDLFACLVNPDHI